MASSSRSAKHSVKELLQSQPYRFSFVQACRLLEQICVLQGRPCESVGYDAQPKDECVRFATLAARSFPPTEVVKLGQLEEPTPGSEPQPPQLTVAFMGLFGPSGVLPHHDTQRIIDAGNRKNPERDFLDVFNHRLISLFYRASTKYRLPFAFESHYKKPGEAESLVTNAFYSLAGMGIGRLRQRLEINDEFSIEFAGLLGLHPKNPLSLQRMLQSYFKLQITVKQFVGQWMFLSDENKSWMPSGKMLGQNCALGSSFILGERVWDVSGKFRIRIGPLDLQEFESLLPGERKLVEVAQIVQLYAGNQFDFDIQLELSSQAVPSCKLGESSRLGYNTWLFAKQPTENKSDAVFVQSGLPVEKGTLQVV
jgi:type VI secretion system protein ImpH